MRSCNHCGKSVANDKTICDRCRDDFEAQELEPPKLLFDKQKERCTVPPPNGPIKSFMSSDFFVVVVVSGPAVIGAILGFTLIGPACGIAGFMAGLLLGLLFVFHSVM